MKVKKIPMRSCVITHEKCEKRELLRIVKDKDGVVAFMGCATVAHLIDNFKKLL